MAGDSGRRHGHRRTRRSGPRLAGMPSRAMTDKVPQVTVLFWIVKVLTTGMGETASDFLVQTIDPVIAVAAAFVALVAVLAFQFRLRRYVAWVYWSAAAMVSVFGTMAADVLHVQFGVPYAVSTAAFAGLLAVVLVAWWSVERTLSIHSIRTSRREAFYWLTVLTTFALGTATGDWTASALGLGYLVSGLVFLVLIALPLVAWRWLGLNAVAAFWIAYVLTRPLGASFADWIGVGPQRGGLGFGTGPITLVLLAAIVVCVAVLARRERRLRAA